MTTVSQPALATIRFQFWRDALSTIWEGKGDGRGEGVPQHPVAVLLGEMKRARPVQKYYLSQMIDVRVSSEATSFQGYEVACLSSHHTRRRPSPSRPPQQPSNPIWAPTHPSRPPSSLDPSHSSCPRRIPLIPTSPTPSPTSLPCSQPSPSSGRSPSSSPPNDN